jgi:uncharacterized RDD family membrane protein YckC
MTCQHCQTWILDVEHRCRRCGRRVRSTPARISPATYPIAATATAQAYDFSAQQEYVSYPSARARTFEQQEPGQQALFSQQQVVEPRIIPFDQLTSPKERESIRARGAELARLTPLKNTRVEASHARPQKRGRGDRDQRSLEFQGEEQVLSLPQASIICDAPVAPAELRIKAALTDGLIMLAGCFICLAFYLYVGGTIATDKHIAPFLVLSLLTIPLVYKLVWVFAGQDSIGMQRLGLRLVDFDGNVPSKKKRYLRLFGSLISLLAAGIGLIWTFVDEDALTWHDHMSNTFPTPVSDN